MKQILTLIAILIFPLAGMFAQADLFNKTWYAHQYLTTFQGKSLYYFHEDSAVNALDLSGMRIDFSSGGTYLQTSAGGETLTEKWVLNAPGDSLELAGVSYSLFQLDSTDLVLRWSSLEVVDQDANLDTAYHYFHLKKLKTVANSVPDASDPSGDCIVSCHPEGDQLRIELAEGCPFIAEVRIVNGSGQQVGKLALKNRAGSVLYVDLQGIPSGTYFLDIIAIRGERIGTRKMMRQ